jgi:hypothetical protein
MRQSQKEMRLAVLSILLISVGYSMTLSPPVSAQDYETQITDVTVPPSVAPGQTFTVSITVRWSNLDLYGTSRKPSYPLHVGICEGVNSCQSPPWETSYDTADPVGTKVFNLELTAPEKSVCWLLTALFERKDMERPVGPTHRMFAVDVAEAGHLSCMGSETFQVSEHDELCITRLFGICPKAEFGVTTSYSAPYTMRQGDIVTLNVRIEYVDYVNRGPLQLTSVSVALRSQRYGSDIVSSRDLSPPSLGSGSAYEREFKLDLLDKPEKPGLYYLVVTWAIGTGTGQSWSYSNSLSLLAGVDTDDDGVFDNKELRIGTNPLKADTDGDGLTDGQEVQEYGTNPLERDTDKDGWGDASEIEKGTNPNAADSDGDGLNDLDEFTRHKTDPLKADTDGDGLNDGDEVYKYHTDPIRADTDGDTLTDGVEVNLGINPLVTDTDRDFWTDSIDPAPANFFVPTGILIFMAAAVVVATFLVRRRATRIGHPLPSAVTARGGARPAGVKYCTQCGELIPEVAVHCPRCASKQE